MKKLIAMALMVTSVAVMGDEVKEVKVEEPKAEVVTLPVEAIPSLTAEQTKEILKRDEERAKWLAERVKKEQEVAEKENRSPIISKIITIDEFWNHQTIECNINDQVVIRLNASNGSRWERGKDENGVMDLLMEYHNEKGVKPRIVTLEFDFDEDEPELVEVVEEHEDKTISVRPFMPVMGMGMGGFGMGMNSTIRPENEVYVFEFQAMKEGVKKLIFKNINTNLPPHNAFPMTFAQAPGFGGGFEGPFPTQPGMMGIGQNMMGPGLDPFGQPLVIPSPIPGFDNSFEITVKVLPNEKTNVTDTVRVKGKDKNNFEVVNREGKTLQVNVGDTIELTLQNKVSSGFDWNNNDDANAGVIKRIDYKPGFGGSFTHTFKVEKAGTCMIDLIYMRPWEPNNFDLNKFYTLRVEAKE